MENQNNHSNKGIIIAVLCLIIGVVLGAMLMGNKVPAGTQEGAALKSPKAAENVVYNSSVQTPSTDIGGKAVGNSGGNPVFYAGSFAKTNVGTWTLNFCAQSSASCPGYGQTIKIEIAGSGGGGRDGQTGGANSKGGNGGGAGAPGAYVSAEYTIPANGSVKSLSATIPAGAVHFAYGLSTGPSGQTSAFAIKDANGANVAGGGAAGGQSAYEDRPGTTFTTSSVYGALFNTVIRANGASTAGNPGLTCSGSDGGIASPAQAGTLQQSLAWSPSGAGGNGGHGGYYRHTAFPTCLGGSQNYGQTAGKDGSPGAIRVTWKGI